MPVFGWRGIHDLANLLRRPRWSLRAAPFRLVALPDWICSNQIIVHSERKNILQQANDVDLRFR
jgi:hypothetical protein